MKPVCRRFIHLIAQYSRSELYLEESIGMLHVLATIPGLLLIPRTHENVILIKITSKQILDVYSQWTVLRVIGFQQMADVPHIAGIESQTNGMASKLKKTLTLF